MERGSGAENLHFGFEDTQAMTEWAKLHAYLVLYEIEAHSNEGQAEEDINNAQYEHMGGRLEGIARHIVPQTYSGERDEAEVKADHVVFPAL